MNKTLTVEKSDKKARLDVFLAGRFPEKSRSFFQKLIKSRGVLVNDQQSSSNYKIKDGDVIKIEFPHEKKLILKKENIPLEIVYEDDDIAVINKPAGMVVHPSNEGNHISGTLVNALLYHFGKDNLSDINGKYRPGIVHRLDKDTSGLLIIAKNNKIHEYIVSLMKKRLIEKTYIALAAGRIKHESGFIDSPVMRSLHDRKKMTIAGENEGKEAVTEFKIDEYVYTDEITFSLLHIKLHTGRTHQIRVHLKSIGHPVAGDSTYGNKKINSGLLKNGLERQFLHACEISFEMPDGKIVNVKSPLPKDLGSVLKKLKQS